MPTILEVIGVAEPTSVNGIPQKLIEGTSLAYTFDAANADAPTTHTTQYFEMFGNRAIYQDGWIACCRHGRLPWQTLGSFSFDDDAANWELYDLGKDWSEAENLAAQHPDKLREMQDTFLIEATKYNVLPLDDRFAERMDASLRPNYFTGRDLVTLYPGMVRLPEGSGPIFANVAHTITVQADVPEDGAEGVLLAVGGDGGGFVLMVRDGKLVYHYNWFNTDRHEIASTEELPTGEVELGIVFTPTGERRGPAEVTLRVNGQDAGTLQLPKQVDSRFSDESIDVGVDMLSPVAPGYPTPHYPFTGVIKQIAIQYPQGGAEHTPEDALRTTLALD